MKKTKTVEIKQEAPDTVTISPVPVDLAEFKRVREVERIPLTDDEFREKLKELYLEHGRSGVVIVQNGTGGCAFNWIGISSLRAVELTQMAKQELVRIVGNE